MRGVMVALLALASAGCSNIPPKVYAVPEPTIVPAPPDSVWPLVIETVSDYRLAVQTIDRTSGLLQTEPMTSSDSTYWDCGQRPDINGNPMRPVPVNVITTLTITATPTGRDSTRVRVVSNPRTTGSGVCVTTGALEREMAAAVHARWSAKH